MIEFNRVPQNCQYIQYSEVYPVFLAGLKPLVEQGKLLERLLILSLLILGMIFYYTILAASFTIQKRSNETAY